MCPSELVPIDSQVFQVEGRDVARPVRDRRIRNLFHFRCLTSNRNSGLDRQIPYHDAAEVSVPYTLYHTMSSLKTYSLRSSPRFRPYIPKALTKGKKASARLKGSFQAPNKGERRITIGSYVPGACQDFELHRRKPQVSFF